MWIFVLAGQKADAQVHRLLDGRAKAGAVVQAQVELGVGFSDGLLDVQVVDHAILVDVDKLLQAQIDLLDHFKICQAGKGQLTGQRAGVTQVSARVKQGAVGPGALLGADVKAVHGQ